MQGAALCGCIDSPHTAEEAQQVADWLLTSFEVLRNLNESLAATVVVGGVQASTRETAYSMMLSSKWPRHSSYHPSRRRQRVPFWT